MKIFNKWPYWIRGGVISLALYILLAISFLLTAPQCPLYTPCVDSTNCSTPPCPTSTLYTITGKIATIVFYPINKISDTAILLHKDTANFVLTIVYSILAGSFLGLLYGKIKNYKSDS